MSSIICNISSHDRTNTSLADIDYLNEDADVKIKYKELCEIHSKKETTNVDPEYRGIKAGGFILDRLVVDSGNQNYNETTSEEIKSKNITRILHDHIRIHGGYKNIVGHKLIISLKPNLDKLIGCNGLNPNEFLIILIKGIIKTLEILYGNTSEKTNTIGYVYGIHQDTNNRHAHIYLRNKTIYGKTVSVSSTLKGKRYNPYQKDALNQIKNTIKREEKGLYETINNQLNFNKKVPNTHHFNHKMHCINSPEFKSKEALKNIDIKANYDKMLNFYEQLSSGQYASLTNYVSHNKDNKKKIVQRYKKEKAIIISKFEKQKTKYLYKKEMLTPTIITESMRRFEPKLLHDSLNTNCEIHGESIKIKHTGTPIFNNEVRSRRKSDAINGNVRLINLRQVELQFNFKIPPKVHHLHNDNINNEIRKEDINQSYGRKI